MPTTPQPRKRTMPRPILSEDAIHPAIRSHIAEHEMAIVKEVQAALAANAVVVVGMAANPFPKKARKALEAAGIAHRYLNGWRRRNALKMWSGWPTFPMVFVKGQLVGGASDVQALIASGEIKTLLA